MESNKFLLAIWVDFPIFEISGGTSVWDVYCMRPCLEFLVIWGLSNDHRFFNNKQALHIGMYSTCGSDIYTYYTVTTHLHVKLLGNFVKRDLVTKSHLEPLCLLSTNNLHKSNQSTTLASLASSDCFAINAASFWAAEGSPGIHRATQESCNRRGGWRKRPQRFVAWRLTLLRFNMETWKWGTLE